MTTRSSAPEWGDLLTVGEEIFSRDVVSSAAIGLTSGFIRLTYFTAKKSETTAAVTMWSGGVAAGATPTLIRWGLWTADADGALLALVAATPNDTGLLVAPNTLYKKSVSTPYERVRGTRYACGLLVVTGAAAPQLTGSTFGVQNAVMGRSPVRCGLVTGQADLPASVAAGSVSSGLNRPYFILEPS